MPWPCYLVEHHPGVSLWRLPGETEYKLGWKDLRPGADGRFVEDVLADYQRGRRRLEPKT